jgi:type IV pilus assembly protein PilV
MISSSIHGTHASGQRGVSLIEVLITLVVTAIGLLGAVALQARAYQTESESYQRAQAAVLLEDIASRMRANKGQAAAYVATDIGAGTVQSCTGVTPDSARDLCEWANLLRGAAETSGGNNVGAMISARSCISQPDPTIPQFVITLVWLGTVPTAAPATACGSAIGDAQLRRALSTVVRIPTLS